MVANSLGERRWPALQHRGFRLFMAAALFARLAQHMQTVAVAWKIYDVTRDPFHLGLVGLTQFLPSLMLVLVTGTVADRFSRRTIMYVCVLIQACSALALLLFILGGAETIWPIYLILTVFGTARAFNNPAQTAMVANLVPPEHLASAVAMNSATWQMATITGPVIGGLLYGLGAGIAFGATAAALVASAFLITRMAQPAQRTGARKTDWDTLVSGVRYIWSEKLVLGAISLDLFAVLLGGATALLPVYARDILEVGPWGLGLLRAAPAIGAIGVAVYLGARTIRDNAGALMLAFVGLFGLLTIIFGLSTITWVSIAALIGIGAADMISVYVRQTLVQLRTPDAVRGRVVAVNMVFVGASNELGEFRAGFMAALIGTVPAVVIGGFGTIGIAAAWAWLFPELRRQRNLTGGD